MKNRKSLSCFAGTMALATVCLAPVNVIAEALDAGDVGVEISRDGAELQAMMTHPPTNPLVLNTALVFTNNSDRPTRVDCIAHTNNGRPAGRTWVRLPANGLRFVLATDINDGNRFLGSADCRTRGNVTGTAFLIGAELTNVDVKQAHRWEQTRINYPVVVYY